MTRSENTPMHAFLSRSIFRTIIHTTTARKFSPREPKCLNGVAVGDWDRLTTREIAPIGAISRLCQNLHRGWGLAVLKNLPKGCLGGW